MLVNSWLYIGIVSYVSASCLICPVVLMTFLFFSLGLCNVLQNVADMLCHRNELFIWEIMSLSYSLSCITMSGTFD